jgi:hypothetical protein
MKDRVAISTPDNVTLEFEMAGAWCVRTGSRRNRGRS